MDSASKSRFVFFGQVIIGVVIYALFNDTSFIQKASSDLAGRMSRKKAIMTVLTAIAIMGAIASFTLVLLGTARDRSLSDQSEASQARLKQDLAIKYLEEGITEPIQFFPVDDRFQVEAKVGPPNDHPSAMDSMVQAGLISFNISGEDIESPVYYATPSFIPGDASGGTVLLFFFKDLTNGKETPQEGRYILLPMATGSLLLDFNQALLLPCSYAEGQNCGGLTEVRMINLSITAGQRR